MNDDVIHLNGNVAMQNHNVTLMNHVATMRNHNVTSERRLNEGAAEWQKERAHDRPDWIRPHTADARFFR